MTISNTQLAQSLQTHLNTLLSRDIEMSNWMNGTFDGGTNSDGMYPLTAIDGTFKLFKCPARLEWEVSNSNYGAVSAKSDAEDSANAALSTLAQINALKALIDATASSISDDKNISEQAKSAAEAAQAIATGNHNNILLLKSDVEAIESSVNNLQSSSFADAGDASDSAVAAELSKTLAIDAQLASEQARDTALAAVNYYTQAQVDQIISDLVNGSPATMDTLNELAVALGDDPNFATTITNQIATKSPLGHGHVYTDISGLASDLASRSLATHNHDTDYSDINHDHDISEVFGLQNTLDSKSSSTHNHDTDYSDINHNHDISEVFGLQNTLDNKSSSAHNHDTDYSDINHDHVINDVIGLQNTLDSKSSSAHNHDTDYSDINHNHTIPTYTNSTDDRDIKPNIPPRGLSSYFTSLTGMTGSANTDYQDLLVLNTYSDQSGGKTNALAFDKSKKSIKHFLANFDDPSTWGGYEELAYLSSKVADSSKLNGQDASYYAVASHTHDYLPLTSKAADSDKLDGYDSSAFGKLSTSQVWTGANNFTNGIVKNGNYIPSLISSYYLDVGVSANTWVGLTRNGTSNSVITVTGGLIATSNSYGTDAAKAGDGEVWASKTIHADGGFKVPYAAGLKKPMVVLDGAETYGLFHTEGASDSLSLDFGGTEALKVVQNEQAYVFGNKIWTTGNDGASSGLDADLLDGYQATAFGKLSLSQAWTGTNSFSQANIQGTIPVKSSQDVMGSGHVLYDMTDMMENEAVIAEKNGSMTAGKFTVLPTNSPMAKGISTTSGANYYSAYIPVRAGEKIITEIQAKQTGITARAYIGVERYDKDKKPIASNNGCNYGGLTNTLLTTSWFNYSYTHTIPTSHTPYNGSDGGGVCYIRLRLLCNYNTTGQAYYTGIRVLRQVQAQAGIELEPSLTTITSTSIIPNLNADLLDGYHGSSASSANTYALRDASGDINCRLVRSNYATVTSMASTADMVFRNSTSDDYLRTCTVDGVKAWLGLDSLPYANVEGRTVTDCNSAQFRESGMYGFSNNPVNGTGESYGAMIVARNSDTGLQIAGGYTNDDLYFRGWSGSGATYYPWRRLLHSNNWSSYVTTSYVSSLNANADTVDGAHANTTGTDITGDKLVKRHASGYIYSNYFNMTANTTSSLPTKVAIETSSDKFVRWQTLADFAANMPNVSSATWADTVDVNTSTSASFYNMNWHSGDTLYSTSSGGGFTYRPSDGFTKIKHGYLGNSRLQHDTGGKIFVTNTAYRRAGMYGLYDSYKTSHIWSMGTAYAIPDNGSTFGNLYGLAYKHTNNTTGGAMAGGHQMVWCANGVGKSALGDNIWTSGNITAYGTSDENLKRDIAEITSPLLKVCSLRTSTFNKLDRATNEYSFETGLIAQDIQKIIPELVSNNDDGDLVIRHGKNELIALAFAAIKELKSEVDILRGAK